ncbi:uncharacterized protein SCHCODRAFT_01327265 [Schizophyllum commune H4-8]|uniref:uncharacterized protein n=1 Tax=Schizophyllum commune (strain H4-8 / FGSC 9210) TaxID=578458 RepID=UPI0021605B0F|nr:uncharacterized protein SCHCODRAFT_01327265 [Schizophyllum commune H4-8]KAI5889663.1 hypothetical protein SCHCODRAFT_01327265 [Schizophyllum commune H4-8]
MNRKQTRLHFNDNYTSTLGLLPLRFWGCPAPHSRPSTTSPPYPAHPANRSTASTRHPILPVESSLPWTTPRA